MRVPQLKRELAREIVRFVWSSSVSGRGDSSRLSLFASGDWQESLEWLHLSGLALLFWDCLKRSGGKNRLPAEVRHRLAQNESDHRLRVAEMLQEFASINRIFDAAGQPYAALKGFALVPGYFPDPTLRVFSDYDYLLSGASVPCIEHAFQAAGYIPCGHDERYSRTYFHNGKPPRLVSNLDEMYSPGLGREIELHWKLWDEHKTGIRVDLPTDFLAHRTVRNWKGLRFAVLADQDAIIYHALHTFRHLIEGWCRLCAIYEVAYFLKERGSEPGLWHRVAARLDGRFRLTQVVAVIFTLAARVFNLRIPALESSLFQVLSPAMTLWLDRYGVESTSDNFAVGRNTLFLYRDFIDERNAWRQVRRRQLFLLKWPSRVRYVSTSSSSGWQAAAQRLAYIAKVVRSQLMGSIRYGCELARWRRALSAQCRCGQRGCRNLQGLGCRLDVGGPVDNQG
jgi:hypothetical protein